MSVYLRPSLSPSNSPRLNEQKNTPPILSALRTSESTCGSSAEGTWSSEAQAQTPSNSSSQGIPSNLRGTTSMPNRSFATLRNPSDPSAGRTSKPICLKRRVSLQDPEPRSRTLAPSGRRDANLSIEEDTFRRNVMSKYPSGSAS